eukprot:5279806-Lingulodinium_polyedra.AAC.1
MAKYLPDANHERRAAADLREVVRSLRSMKLRKAPVPWDLPLEVWSILLDPERMANPARRGVGASSPMLEAPHFKEM